MTGFRYIPLLALTVALACAPARLGAETTFPANGSPGDAKTDDRCPGGMSLVGLQGRTGAWVDQIQIICAAIPQGGVQGPLWFGPARGGMGGGPASARCAPDSVAYLAAIQYNAGNKQVVRVTLYCNSPRGRNVVTLGAQGVATGDTQPCPGREVAAGSVSIMADT